MRRSAYAQNTCIYCIYLKSLPFLYFEHQLKTTLVCLFSEVFVLVRKFGANISFSNNIAISKKYMFNGKYSTSLPLKQKLECFPLIWIMICDWFCGIANSLPRRAYPHIQIENTEPFMYNWSTRLPIFELFPFRVESTCLSQQRVGAVW